MSGKITINFRKVRTHDTKLLQCSRGYKFHVRVYEAITHYSVRLQVRDSRIYTAATREGRSAHSKEPRQIHSKDETLPPVRIQA